MILTFFYCNTHEQLQEQHTTAQTNTDTKKTTMHRSLLQPPRLSIAAVAAIIALFLLASAAPVARAQSVLWHFDASDTVTTVPVVFNGSVFFGTTQGDGQMRSLSVATGAVEWTYFPGALAVIRSTPVVVKSTLLCFGTSIWKFVCVNVNTGLQTWMRYFAGGVQVDPVYSSNVIYVGADDGNFYALNSDTGNIIWTYSAGSYVRGSPVLFGTTAVIFGCVNGDIHSVATATGAMNWKYTAQAAVRSPLRISQLNYVLFGVDNGDACAVDASAGFLVWRYSAKLGAVWAPPAEAADGSAVYMAYPGGVLRALSPTTGVSQWSVTLVGNTTTDFISAPRVDSGLIWVGVSDGSIAGVNATTAASTGATYKIAVTSKTPVSQLPIGLSSGALFLSAGVRLTAVGDPSFTTTTAAQTTVATVQGTKYDVTRVSLPAYILASQSSSTAAVVLGFVVSSLLLLFVEQ